MASRVTLQLWCTGSPLQWLPLQWSRGSTARGLPWLQRVASAVVTEGSGHVALGRDDMALQKYQTTLSCQLARSSLPTRASLLAVPISDSSWSSRGCSLDLGGEHPPAFPTVMGVEATVLSAVDFIHYHDTIFVCSVFFHRNWVMEVDNVLVSSPGIELVGLFKNVRILYLLVTSALRR